jgi:hypothetical protein
LWLVQRFAGWLRESEADSTEVCRLVEGAEAEVVIILAIVLVYTDGHNTMATTV